MTHVCMKLLEQFLGEVKLPRHWYLEYNADEFSQMFDDWMKKKNEGFEK